MWKEVYLFSIQWTYVPPTIFNYVNCKLWISDYEVNPVCVYTIYIYIYILIKEMTDDISKEKNKQNTRLQPIIYWSI